MINRLKRAFNIPTSDVKIIEARKKENFYTFKVGDHIVTMNNALITCSCPDFEYRGAEVIGSNMLCKHQLKVIMVFHENLIKQQAQRQ